MVRWHRANGRKGFIFVVVDAHEVIIVFQRNVSLQQALMVLFNHFVRWSETIIVREIISCLRLAVTVVAALGQQLLVLVLVLVLVQVLLLFGGTHKHVNIIVVNVQNVGVVT